MWYIKGGFLIHKACWFSGWMSNFPLPVVNTHTKKLFYLWKIHTIKQSTSKYISMFTENESLHTNKTIFTPHNHLTLSSCWNSMSCPFAPAYSSDYNQIMRFSCGEPLTRGFLNNHIIPLSRFHMLLPGNPPPSETQANATGRCGFSQPESYWASSSLSWSRGHNCWWACN